MEETPGRSASRSTDPGRAADPGAGQRVHPDAEGNGPSGWQAGAIGLSVVMPAHNEEPYLDGAVMAVVDGLAQRVQTRRLTGPFEVIVVENGSTDRTVDIARKLADSHAEVRFMSLSEADYGRALRAGFLSARGNLVANFDVDYVDLSFLDAALAVMTHPEAESLGQPVIVVGSKRGPGSDDHRGVGRRLVTAVFSAALRHGFGLRVSDTHGVKLLRREPLTPLVDASRFGGAIFDTEIVLRAERAGWTVAELPVTVTEQRPPRTSILRRIPRSLLGLCRLRWMLWREERRR
ncbi:MAG: glycosyltransferase [Acidimicrobiaceae bacterium]|nr:glycosyltransferase [Acidimicrobiaceae bacterium]